MSELIIVIWLLLILLLPGWTFLSLGEFWRDWKPLQRWFVALGISLASIPLFFYLTRLIPLMRIGQNKILVILIALAITLIIKMRKHWREQFQFDRDESFALLILLATLFIRLWQAHLHPFPAWSDSLHHSLITKIVVETGRLPYNLEPYEPVSLSMYHLGLYSISGILAILADIPAHTSISWLSQFLNGLSGIGLYLVLDRKVGRKGALTALFIIGFLSTQPARYFNWGRFTQVSAQTLMFVAWIVTWEAFRIISGKETKKSKLAHIIIASALLNAGVFFLHFRVAGFYVLLLGITILFELTGIKNQLPRKLAILGTIGVISIVLISPAISSAMESYSLRFGNGSVQKAQESGYYDLGEITELPYLIGQPWLILLGVLSAGWGLVKKEQLVIISFLWIVGLFFIGNAYQFGMTWLSFSNYSGILIMHYLPIVLCIGTLAENISAQIKFTPSSERIVMVIILLLGFIGSHFRVADVEKYRFFMTEEDLPAMEWIKNNTLSDAVFAVETYMWLGINPHGTDAGYWIPYFTGRKTTTGTMLFSLGSKEYQEKIRNTSQTVLSYFGQRGEPSDLCYLGIDYLYLTGTHNIKYLVDDLKNSQENRILYYDNRVIILQTCEE